MALKLFEKIFFIVKIKLEMASKELRKKFLIFFEKKGHPKVDAARHYGASKIVLWTHLH